MKLLIRQSVHAAMAVAHTRCFFRMSEFFEAIWCGQGIGDGGDLEEALQSYVAVKPDDGDWVAACAATGSDPTIERFTSFDAYLDNADPLESIAVTPQMIIDAIALLPQ